LKGKISIQYGNQKESSKESNEEGRKEGNEEGNQEGRKKEIACEQFAPAEGSARNSAGWYGRFHI
jgi:hypothetical protein